MPQRIRVHARASHVLRRVVRPDRLQRLRLGLASGIALACLFARQPAMAADAPPCGDVNADGTIDITDGISILVSLFGTGAADAAPRLGCGGSTLSCGDLNGDSRADLSDAAYLFAWLFTGGPAPVCDAAHRQIQGFTFAHVNDQGYAEYVHNLTGIDFALLPGGLFAMGSPCLDLDDQRLQSMAPCR